MLKPLEGSAAPGRLRPVAGGLRAGVLIEVKFSRGPRLSKKRPPPAGPRDSARRRWTPGPALANAKRYEILIAAFILDHHFVTTAAAIDQPLEQAAPWRGIPRRLFCS